MKIGVVGAGQMGRHHVRVCADLDDVELVGVVDASAEARARVHKRHGVQVFERLEHLLTDARPEAVIIALPTRLHHEAALAVIEAGLPVLVEKPIAATLEQGRSLVEVAERRGVQLAVGHIERFNPAVDALKRQLDEDALGRLYQINARRLGPFPPRIADVGVVVDLATHDLNIIEHVAGASIERVYAETARRIHAAHEDMVSAVLRLEGGTVGVLDINWLTPTKVRELWVHGEKGLLRVDYVTQDLYFFENAAPDGEANMMRILGVSEGRMIRYPVAKKEPLVAELSSFVESVRSGERPKVDGAEGLRALELALAIVESGESQRVVLTAGAGRE